MVGGNVNRIAPLYVLHNLIAPDFESHPDQGALRDLAINAEIAARSALRERIPTQESSRSELSRTSYGVFAPDRRIFHNKKTGGAYADQGAPFPVVGGLATRTASDDGLGRRLRELIECKQTDWQDRLRLLFLPEASQDPVTGFATLLLGGTPGSARDDAPEASDHAPQNPLDEACANFIDNLIVPQKDARRIGVVRDLAIGAFLMSIVRLVAGPVVESGKHIPLVFVFGGIPPGNTHDALVHAAYRSFDAWISASWRATAEGMARRISATPTLSDADMHGRRGQSLKILLAESLGQKTSDIDGIIASMTQDSSHAVQDEALWCRQLMASKTVSFPPSQLSRRIRNLGSKVGFAGPDRGRANPRLLMDTPLLGVISKGVVGQDTMEFREFVTQLTTRFGLVVGPGVEEEVVDRIDLAGSDGYNAFEILANNQEIFRERLLRTGLARSYSDSHTEVLGFNVS